MPPRQWEPLVADFSRVMQLVHLAMRRDATDIESLKGDLFKAKRQAYEDGLTAQAANVGCAGRRGIAPPEVMRAMNEEAGTEAAGIVNTYNYDLAVAIRHVRTEVPRANRFTYAKRLGAWEDTRDIWKSKQIALWNQMNWLDKAISDFLAHNPQLTKGRARVVPRGAAVCDVCRDWIAKGWVPIERTREIEWPAHLNCPHRWEIKHARQKVDCEELWVGVPIQQWWEAEYREYRTLTNEKGGAGSGNWGHAGRPGLVGGSSTVGATMTTEPLNRRLLVLRPRLAEAAQRVYDDWTPDEYGGGGICDDVSMAMGEVIAGEMDVELRDGGQPGDDHAWLIVIDQEAGEVRGVDIPASVYEEGGGYAWSKIEDVTIRPDDVQVFDIGWSMEEVMNFLEPGEGWEESYDVGYSEKAMTLPDKCVIFVRGQVDRAKASRVRRAGAVS